MGNITWLASYHKSGNTWMRILLTNYLRDNDTPADINKLVGGPIASSRAFFDKWVGVEASSFDEHIIMRLRPEVYRCMAREASKTLFIKAHDAWCLTDRNEALFPGDITAGVVYIMRNPLDIAKSCAHHWGVKTVEAVDCMCDSGFSTYNTTTGLPDQLRQCMLSWSGHVRSWLDESGLPVHVVRYEDLRRDALATFADVVRFCKLPYDEVRVRKAVGFSDFNELQRQEQEKGFSECPVNAAGPFFRRGQAGSWREELLAALVKRLIEAHGETMKRFGYLDENYEPV